MTLRSHSLERSSQPAIVQTEIEGVVPCVLVYSASSGHGHLDSWNTMFIKILLSKGFTVLALTPEGQGLQSRLTRQGYEFSESLQILDYFATSKPNFLTLEGLRYGAISILRHLWHRWSAFGVSYCSNSASNEILYGMRGYWRNQLFRVLVPPVYRVTYLFYAGSRRLMMNLQVFGSNPDQELPTGNDPIDFAKHVNRAIKSGPQRPNFVLNMYLDAYRTTSASWSGFDRISKWPWGGICFAPRLDSLEGYHSTSTLKGIFLLDRSLLNYYRQRNPKITFEYLPDITYSTVPDYPSPLVKKIKKRAAGRIIVVLGGAIGRQKNLASWFNVIELADPIRWYFVQVGEIYEEALTVEDKIALNRKLLNPPENFFIINGFINEEEIFNDIIRASDIIYAVYRDFTLSSNMLSKAACLKKPILVSENYLMGERVNHYGIGRAVDERDAHKIYQGLLMIWQSPPAVGSFERYNRDFDLQDLSVILTDFIERCAATPSDCHK